MQELSGKVAVVTGGASGIGHALATRFAEEGMKLVLLDVEAGPLDEAARGFEAQGVEVLAQRLDVSDAAALDAAGHADLPVMAGLETVAGVVDARTVTTHPRVRWCYFGAEDYVADLGGVRTEVNHEVAVARAQVGQAAALGGVQAIDMVVADFGDADRFRREAVEARALGFSGKLCIHPAQVPLASEAFHPSEGELGWAQAVTEAYDAALARGEASIQVDGSMVDEPVARRARALLAEEHTD